MAWLWVEGRRKRACEVFLRGKDEPTLFPLKPVLCSSGLSCLTLLLGCISGLGGVGEGTGAGSVLGLLTYFWLRAQKTSRLARASGLASLGRVQEAQAGAREKSQGLSLLLWWPSVRLWAVSWSFESGRVLGSSQGLCQPASVPSTQLVEEHRCSGISGNHIIQMNFFQETNTGFPEKTEVHLIPLRMFWLADSGFEELTSSGLPFQRTLENSRHTVSPILVWNTFPVLSYPGYT